MGKQFCLRGHDTFKTGRRNSGACRACANERSRRQKAEQKALRELKRPVPHGPLCSCEMCFDRQMDDFYDRMHAQYEEAQWEKTA